MDSPDDSRACDVVGVAGEDRKVDVSFVALGSGGIVKVVEVFESVNIPDFCGLVIVVKDVSVVFHDQKIIFINVKGKINLLFGSEFLSEDITNSNLLGTRFYLNSV